jgi:hypothetical protein
MPLPSSSHEEEGEQYGDDGLFQNMTVFVGLLSCQIGIYKA